jgi:protoheme IX farnesyltransferase
LVNSAVANAWSWRDYYSLTKPRVVALIVLTSVVGTLLAVPGWPPMSALLFGNLGVALAAASAAAINHVLDRRIDAHMALPTGHLRVAHALWFAFMLGAVSMLVLVLWVNVLTAALTFASLIGYAVIYTVWLKRATPQNIVIGGAAGAAPPVLGWCAVTNSVDPQALLLFLIIFAWNTPRWTYRCCR